MVLAVLCDYSRDGAGWRGLIVDGWGHSIQKLSRIAQRDIILVLFLKLEKLDDLELFIDTISQDINHESTTSNIFLKIVSGFFNRVFYLNTRNSNCINK